MCIGTTTPTEQQHRRSASLVFRRVTWSVMKPCRTFSIHKNKKLSYSKYGKVNEAQKRGTHTRLRAIKLSCLHIISSFAEPGKDITLSRYTACVTRAATLKTRAKAVRSHVYRIRETHHGCLFSLHSRKLVAHVGIRNYVLRAIKAKAKSLSA